MSSLLGLALNQRQRSRATFSRVRAVGDPDFFDK